MDIRGKRVLVTGASGFIGGHLAVRLARDEGARVRAMVRGRVPDYLTKSGIEIAVGDMLDAEAVYRAAAGSDLVFHCAAKQFPPGTRAQFIAENAGGFENLARAALANGAVRFVHLSTINVHGFPPPSDCDAESPLRPSGDFYSDSKIETERVAWRYCADKGLPLVIIRPACTYGPRGGAWTLTPIRRVRAGKRVLIGDGSGICNPAFVNNLVDLILLAAQNENAVGQAFIGSDGIGVSWREFYGAYARMMGIRHLNSVPLAAARSIALVSEAVARVTGTRPWVARQSVEFYSHRVVYDISKARDILGYHPRVSFEEGMRRTQQWLVERER